MRVNPVGILPLGKLRSNPDNPRKPLGRVYARGLEASLEEFGLSGIFNVAENEDGTFEILDGNTRVDLLDGELSPDAEVGVILHPDMKEGEPDWQERRREFVLAFDRNRKLYDEDKVLAQLKALAASGRDLARLSVLTAQENLKRLIEESSGQARAAQAASQSALGRAAAQKSLTLYGPAEDVDAIGQLIKRIRGRISPVIKLRQVLEQFDQFQDLEDTRFLVALGSAIKRIQDLENE